MIYYAKLGLTYNDFVAEGGLTAIGNTLKGEPIFQALVKGEKGGTGDNGIDGADGADGAALMYNDFVAGGGLTTIENTLKADTDFQAYIKGEKGNALTYNEFVASGGLIVLKNYTNEVVIRVLDVIIAHRNSISLKALAQTLKDQFLTDGRKE